MARSGSPRWDPPEQHRHRDPDRHGEAPGRSDADRALIDGASIRDAGRLHTIEPGSLDELVAEEHHRLAAVHEGRPAPLDDDATGAEYETDRLVALALRCADRRMTARLPPHCAITRSGGPAHTAGGLPGDFARSVINRTLGCRLTEGINAWLAEIGANSSLRRRAIPPGWVFPAAGIAEETEEVAVHPRWARAAHRDHRRGK